MMKKIFSKVLICIITLSSLFTLAGCEFTSKNDADNNFNKSEKNSNTGNTSDNGEYFDLYGIDIAVPLSFKSERIYSKRVWSGKKSTNDMIYYDIDFLLDYGSVASIDSYSLSDTPDIMWEYIREVIDNYYPAGVKSTISID